MKKGDSWAAVKAGEAALRLCPESAAVHGLLGKALALQGRNDEAVVWFRRVVASAPDLVEPRLELGCALERLGRLEEAATQFRSVIDLRPAHAEAHLHLGVVLLALDRPAEALAACREAVAGRRADAETYFVLGNALAALERDEEALAEFRQAMALRPRFPEALLNSALLLMKNGNPAEAWEMCRQLVDIDPAVAGSHHLLGIALQQMHRLEEAERALRQAIAMEPDQAQMHNDLGCVLWQRNRLAEAEQAFRRAIALAPDEAKAHNNLGVVLGERGDIDGAVNALEKSVALDPSIPEHFRNLGQYHRFHAGDPYLAALEGIASHEDRLVETERIHLHFALGKALDDIGRYDEAFTHFLEGNALKRRTTHYDEELTLGLLDRIASTVTSDLLATNKGLGLDDPAPVFIVGMPRSGTTLVEQILSSHPSVHGAGELRDLDDLIVTAFGSEAALLDALPSLGGANLADLGRRYMLRVRPLAPDAGRIVDKMITNFRHAGLIHLILPRARIIHVRRDPIDTCMSCFSNLFDSLPQTYDLDELGRYYRAYLALTAHWRAVLPPGIFLEIDYEDVVADLEGTTRRILDHCGLPWDDACLDFHRTVRTVRTASSCQVRRPLYKEAVGHWHAYAAAARLLAIIEQ